MLYDKRWETEPVEIPAINPKKPRAKPKPLGWRGILLKAATILEERGWCRGHYQRSGRVCALGALNAAVGYPPAGPLPDGGFASNFLMKRNDELQTAKNHLVCAVGIDVASWNDNIATNSQHVISTLRKVAKI